MPRGPKGEYRPADPIRSAHLMMGIITGEITEADAERLYKPKKCAVKRKAKTKKR